MEERNWEYEEKQREKIAGYVEKYDQTEVELGSDINKLLEELKDVNNEYQEIIGSIRVNVRVRPFITNDKFEDQKTPTVTCDSRNELSLRIPSGILKSENHQQEYYFNFERIYPSTSTQDNLFSELSSLIQSSIDGHNVCVFSYGQTGAGKTYTMLGGEDSQSLGLLPRTVDLLFARAEQLEKVGVKCSFGVCFTEIYNNKMVNLLDEQRSEMAELLSRMLKLT